MNRADYLLWGAKATALRGSALPQAKLDEAKARYVKQNPRGKPARVLAEELGVHIRTIENINAGLSWRHA